MKKTLCVLLCAALCFSAAACGNTPSGPEEPVKPDPDTPGGEVDTSYRVGRNFGEMPLPSATVDESALPAAKMGSVSESSMTSGSYSLQFVKSAGAYSVRYTDGNGKVMFESEKPAQVYLRASLELSEKYDSVEKKEYGFLATARLTSSAGSELIVEDRYYLPEEAEGVFNVAKQVTVVKAGAGESGFESVYTVSSPAGASGNYDWFIPNHEFASVSYRSNTYRETNLGAPFIMMRNRTSGATLSLGRYQPVIHYENNNYASLSMTNAQNAGSISVEYPSKDSARKFHPLAVGSTHALHMSMRVENTKTHGEATVSAYNAHFALQNQRIVATDIDEVYKVVCEDYKTFLHTTEQTDKETGKKYNSYGLPWRITIEDGEFGPLTYQAGFIGQQLPSAYNMMLYGIMNDDLTSLQNGVNVFDFWVSGAEFMSAAGVPYIWYDTWADGFRSYPCFLRMAVDAMEGLLDGYRLVTAHGIDRPEWLNAIERFGDFLVNYQNADGSYFRCYNYDGEPFKNWDNGIEEPQGNICQSESKLNTNLPVRFLAKMYEFSGDERYKTAALQAGEFVYENIYPTGVYTGGTCDNPNRVDKESGVYAMYCYDALYTLTGESKWLQCLKEATAFTMSTVQIYSYPVRGSALKAAYPCEHGYNDGMSFICVNTQGADNYIAFIYYELFRIYVLTGDSAYLKQAEFIQQNTKSIMNWDGALGYKYKSLVAEASTTSGFTFSSASDGAWVTWSSAANIEPIAKMYTGFGKADVAEFAGKPLSELKETLKKIGAGGYEHTVYENTVADQIR